ncbi:hypothetical protein CUMW_135020 [Citrus unshiu]|nr:hypothetical protein CUMW_135020 [Citrus unshiu]
MASKSKILFIGGTGYIGKFIVEASAKAGHPTFVLVRESTLSAPSKSQLLDHFKKLGVNLVIGDVLNHESLVKAIKQVDVVISTVGHTLLADQVKIIAAIKEAGNIKRFFPSEFGNDVDRVHAVEPAKSAFATKAKIRRAVEAEGIPYTYVASNFFAAYFLPNLSQPGATAPPRDKGDVLNHGSLVKAIKQVDVVISTVGHTLLADQVKIIAAIKEAGNVKRFFPSEFGNDVDRVNAVEPAKSAFVTKAKIRRAVEAEGIPYTYVASNFFAGYFLPNLSQPGATAPPRDKRKIGKTLQRVYVPEEQVLKNIQEAAPPVNVILSIQHSAFVKGDQTNFQIEPSFGVEASQLYPDVKYTTVDEYLSHTQ